jgi:hypothetical protein
MNLGVHNSDGVPPSVQRNSCARAQRRNGTGFAGLPQDVLNTISDFDGKGVVRAISTHTWDTLGYRNLHMFVTPGNVSKILLAISNQALTIVDNMSFTVRCFDSVMLETLSMLCMETSALRLVTPGCPTRFLGPDWRRYCRHPIPPSWDIDQCEFLGETFDILAAAPHLRILDLDLTRQLTPDRVSENLVALKQSKTLQKLRLALMRPRDGFTDHELPYLATLNECRTLETVHINLVGYHLSRKRQLDSALALNGLKDLPLLRVLSLEINEIDIGPAQIRALVDLRPCPLLETFEINFIHVIKPRLGIDEFPIITNPGFHVVLPREVVCSLGGLKDALHLSTLHLGLEYNAMNNPDVGYLVDILLAAPALHTLHLNLAHNYIYDGGAIELARLADASNLKCLNLNLEHNQIGTMGAVPLLKMKALFELHINLKDNPYVSDDIIIATHPTSLKFHGGWLSRNHEG